MPENGTKVPFSGTSSGYTFTVYWLFTDSDGSGLDFSGFGRARAFMYRASGGPGFFVSGFGLYSGFSKV